MRPSRKHRRRYLVHLDDRVGRNIGAPRRIANGVGVFGLIKTVGFALVGTQKGEDPLHSFFIVDEIELFRLLPS